MATLTGTGGNDTLIGTSANDVFVPLLGHDTVNGGEGFDRLNLDYSSLAMNAGTTTLAAGTAGSFSGSVGAGSPAAASVLFSAIEEIVLTLSAGSDTVVLDGAPLAAGALVSINGGGGFDTLRADFSAFANTAFSQGANFLITSSHGTFAGFEQFDLTLGSGANAVTTQGGNDIVRSTGGIDQIDLGGGRDTWIADYSSYSAPISFGWDGDRNVAAVSNGTNVSNVESGAITGGSADDAFFLNGFNPFAVDGGPGRDMLIWDETGHLGPGYAAIFEDGGEGSFQGSIRNAGFTSIEQVNAALSDADNYAFVDTAALALGATMNLDGGGGFDALDVDFSSYADTAFALDESGTALTSHGTYAHFEQFGMALGGGTNTVTTGVGDDTIYSLGGRDQIDGGDGFDAWGGDYSESAADLSFVWNGGAGTATLSNGTVLNGIETGYLLTGAGNDSFALTGLASFDVFGGAGNDQLTRDDTGLLGASANSFFYSAGGWFFGSADNGQFDEIEHITVTFSDDDNTVYVNAAPLAAGAVLMLNGGVGSDTLLIDFSAFTDTTFTVGGDGAVTSSHGSYSGFERFSIGLGDGVNTIMLGAGDDSVQSGYGGANTISTGAGNDAIWGGTGAETVLGGAGNDTFYVAGNAAGFTIAQDGLGGYILTDMNLADGDQGTDHLTDVEWLQFSDQQIALPAYAIGMTLIGTAGDDQLIGTAFNDNLSGRAGNDILTGGDGSDLLNGGAGNDTISGGPGTDTLTYADATAAVTVKLAVLGKAQNTVGSGNDWLVDSLENLTGSAYNDRLIGNAQSNVISGLAGNDTLDGGPGADTLIGGRGNDRYVVDNPDDVLIENANEGIDVVTTRVSWTLGVNFEKLTLLGTLAIDGTGNDGANVLTGNNAANHLLGLAGNDRLDGRGGADSLVGGLGNDTYVVDNAGDTVIENAGEGTDLVLAKVDWTLDANIEKLTLTGSLAIDGTGNVLGNTLTGNAAVNHLYGLDGNDRIDGKGGADTLVGGLGNDTYLVDNVGDTIIENVGEGNDIVLAKIDWTLGANIEKLTLTGPLAIDGTGNELANVLTGNSSANQLFGLGGNDTLSGGAGNDLLVGGMGADILIGGAGADRFRFDVLEIAARKDTIKDFTHTADHLEFSRAAFTAFAADPVGALDPLELALGIAATTASQHLVYTQSTGALYYDPDGVGGAAQVQVALFTTKPLIDAGDIMLI